jgi:membrane associated rhomboid family serine protease
MSEQGNLEPAKPSRRREPVFNNLPLGVAGLIGAILMVHGLQELGDMNAKMAAWATFAVVPARLEAGFGTPPSLSGAFQQIMPFFAHQFMHGGLVHMLMNLAMLLQVGPVAERGIAAGPDRVARFLVFFLLSGAVGGLFFCWVNAGGLVPTLGASGAISGVFAGYLWAALRFARGRPGIMQPVLTSAAVFLFINVGLAALARVSGILPIAWESHLGGFIGGLVLYPLLAEPVRRGAPDA